MRPRTSFPTRTCVGCRKAASASQLARLALRDGIVMLAVSAGRPSGRGAWIHPSDVCLEKAARTRAFDRAFRTSRASIGVRSEDLQALGQALDSGGM